MAIENEIYPVDSRFIFKLIQNASNQQNKTKLYRLLLLNSNDGQSFAGEGNRVNTCWWYYEHASFFYNALCMQDAGIGLEIDVECDDSQRFPLPKDRLQWNIIAQEINKKIKNSKRNHIDEEFRMKQYDVDDIEDQLTFESHVFNVLCKSFDLFSTENEKRDYVIKFCKNAKIPQYEINRIEETEEFKDILAYIVMRARENYRSPLIIAVSNKESARDDTVKDWQILAANKLEMDPMEVSARVMENDRNLYHQLPESVVGNQRQWADVFISFPSFCRFLVDPQGEIQGNFSAVGLTREQERKMSQGRFVDSGIDVCFCDPLHAPGDHILYLLNLSVNPEVGLERYYALWDELIALLKKSAKEGVYFTKIYYKAFLPQHRAMVIGRGFRFVCNDAEYGTVFVHEMNPATTLRVMDEELASLYRERKNRMGRLSVASNDELEAEAGFRNMFRMIDELFRHPRLAEMKPYFFSSIEPPEDENQRQLGIATAELLRDILQYAKSLLDYLNEDFLRTYDDYYEMIMESALVRAGIEQYQFATEHPDFKHKKLGIDQVNAKDIVNFAMIWIELDKLFIMRDDVLKLRSYFYELRESSPSEDEIPVATTLVVRLLSAMKISESLLDRIPNHLVVSYHKYKNMVKSIRVVQEVVEQNQFLKEELNW